MGGGVGVAWEYEGEGRKTVNRKLREGERKGN